MKYLFARVKAFFKRFFKFAPAASSFVPAALSPSSIIGAFNGKRKAKVGALIRITPGLRHGWYESDMGPIRKELSKMQAV